MSDFFDPPPPPRYATEILPPEDWMAPPPTVLPGVVPVEQVVARTEEVAVYVDSLFAYPTGFEIQLVAVAKEGRTDLKPFDYEHDLQAEREGAIPPQKLRVGFEFAGGASVTNIRGERPQDEGLPPKPTMSGTQGQWSEDEWEQGYWIWPLPPPGPMNLACEWPAAGIPLTRLGLDSAAIIAAAARAQTPF